MKLHFLGGVQGVTGSRYLLETQGKRILIDCGLFQGIKNLRLRNWKPFPVEPASIDVILLTHAHIDHSGYIPRLVKSGFKGQIHCTSATLDLCKIILPDSGYLQEEEARYRNKGGTSKHHPALPLYTEKEARNCLSQFEVHGLGEPTHIHHCEVTFLEAGHILGASSIGIKLEGKSFVFSGDLGRFDDQLMTRPDFCPEADYIIMESTYGGRNHSEKDPIEVVGEILKDLLPQNGVLVIPAFAVGRAQSMLFVLQQVFKRYPELTMPVYLNSPMSINVTGLFKKHLGEHKLSQELCDEVCGIAEFTNSMEASIKLNAKKGPMVIVSASGMLSGGRVLHHLKAFGSDNRNAILLAGFQAAGTRGHKLLNGGRELKIHGDYVSIKAKVYTIDSLSAHADQRDLIAWIEGITKGNCKQIFLTHGEPSSSDALRVKIKDEKNIDCYIPQLGEVFEI